MARKLRNITHRQEKVGIFLLFRAGMSRRHLNISLEFSNKMNTRHDTPIHTGKCPSRKVADVAC